MGSNILHDESGRNSNPSRGADKHIRMNVLLSSFLSISSFDILRLTSRRSENVSQPIPIGENDCTKRVSHNNPQLICLAVQDGHQLRLRRVCSFWESCLKANNEGIPLECARAIARRLGGALCGGGDRPLLAT